MACPEVSFARLVPQPLLPHAPNSWKFGHGLITTARFTCYLVAYAKLVLKCVPSNPLCLGSWKSIFSTFFSFTCSPSTVQYSGVRQGASFPPPVGPAAAPAQLTLEEIIAAAVGRTTLPTLQCVHSPVQWRNLGAKRKQPRGLFRARGP